MILIAGKMKRKSENYLKNWMVEPNRKPLVIRGARQVGKSTLVRQAVADAKLKLLEINCEQNPKLDAVFKTLNCLKILDEIESLPGKKAITPSTVLFFDEVQATPNALASLRYFYEEQPALKIICAGSLLEFALTEHSFSMPVGRIEFLHIVPMDFEEFLLACDEQKLLDVLNSFSIEHPMSKGQHERFLDLQRQYCFTGGMPEAVREFIQKKKLSAARHIHDSILETYKTDFAKYGLRQDLPRLGQILDQAAQRISQRVKFNQLLADEQSKTIRRLLNLLVQARLLSVVTHSDASDIPLGAEMRPEIFKLLGLDIGLINALLGLPWNYISESPSVMTIRDGSIAEQFVGQELIASVGRGKQNLHYWLREGKKANAEVDYLVVLNGVIVPIEVKAGKSGTLRSLRMFCESKRPSLAIRFDSNLPSIQKIPFEQSGPTPQKKHKTWDLVSLPSYASSQIERICIELS